MDKTMVERLQHKYALSEQGAKDMVKACAAVTVSNIVMMLPAMLLYYLIADLLNGKNIVKANNIELTFPSNVYYIKPIIRKTNETTIVASEIENAKLKIITGVQYDYTLGKIKGSIDNWYVEKSWGKYTFTGNESLTLQNNNKRARFSLSNVISVSNDTTLEKIYCNILKAVRPVDTWYGVQGISYDIVKDVIEISINSCTTLAQYQQALKDNYVIYKLLFAKTYKILIWAKI